MTKRPTTSGAPGAVESAHESVSANGDSITQALTLSGLNSIQAIRGTGDGVRRLSVGRCIFEYSLATRRCSTIFPDGRSTDAWSGENEGEASLTKWSVWGYERSDLGVAVGLIEHEASHSLVTTALFGLPWSPELFSQAHGYIANWHSRIPPELRPWPEYSIPFEEALCLAVTVYLRSGRRWRGWNRAFPDSDPLDYIAGRTDLDAFLGKMRARLDALWEDTRD